VTSCTENILYIQSGADIRWSERGGRLRSLFESLALRFCIVLL